MKKFFLICAALASLLCLTLGLAGCDFGSGGSAHEHEYTETVVAPTCTERGYTLHTCACGYSYKDSGTSALGHSWDEGTVIRAATCTAEGSVKYTCTVCQTTKTEAVGALGHSFTEYISDGNATCTQDGTKTAVCDRNGCSVTNTVTDESSALGHDYISHEAQAATCTEIGWETYYTCSRCDYSTYEEIPALGHEWEWEEQTEETHTGECTVCGEVLTEAAHEWEDNVCTVCGYDAGGSKGLEWTLQTEGDVQYYAVSGIGSCTDADIIIPATYNGIAVTKIAQRAFYNVTAITAITIPESITSIGNYAFDYCFKLVEVYNCSTLKITAGSTNNGYVGYYAKNVYTPSSGASKLSTTEDGYLFYEDGDTVYLLAYKGTDTELILPDTYNGKNYEIYEYAFYYDTSITSVTLGSGVTSISTSAFWGCTGLTEITIPDGVTSIGAYAFYGCTGLTSIMIPDSVTYIGSYAFSGCTSLTEITIPDSVTSIGTWAFSDCTSLKSITIPDSVTSIGDYAFSGCSNLTYHEYENAYYLGNESNPYLVLVKATSTSITSCTVHENTKIIYYQAFYNCISLTEITIPDSVTSIGSYAFYNCTSLTEIYYNATECADLSSNSSVFYDAGQSGEGITVYIGANVKSIPAYLFNNASYITSIVFAEGSICTSIGDYAFGYCISLTSIEIPSSVTSISDYAFRDCTGLTEIYYNATECADLRYNNSWIHVFSNAGQSGGGITVYIGANVKSIPAYLFNNASYITSVVFAEGSECASIGSYAFSGCTGLTSVTIGSGVTSIGTYAFSNCKGLTGINYYAEECADLNSNNYVFSNAGISGEGVTVIIGANVKRIPAYLFCPSYSFSSYMSNLVSVVFEEGSVCTSIGMYAFYYCTSLESILIPDSVETIGNNAFSGCSTLTYNEYDNAYYLGNYSNPYVVLMSAISTDITSVTIHENTKCIYNYAFYNCTGLTSITIPASVTSIGSSAFGRCNGLTGVYITDIAAWYRITFSNYAANPLYYAGSLYLNGTIIKGSLVISDGVTSISSCAFYNCTGLTSITIPASVTSIGDYAFYNCTGLTSINIPDGVTSIGDRAFSGCAGLTSITIPNSVTSIGNYAFSGCSNLSYNTYDNAYYLGNDSNPYLVLVEATSTSITSCTIHEDTKIICYRAFIGCAGLTSITIPDSVTSIGSYAFKDCTGLTSVTIGNSVTSIGDSAFYGCTGLTKINYNAEECADLSYNNYAFSNAGQNGEGITVYIGANVTSIPVCLFYPDNNSSYAPKLVSVVFAAGSDCTSIGSYAFYDCTSLTSITIPDSVTSIGSDAFWGCYSLTTVYYGGSAEEWNEILIGIYNTYLTDATVYYYSESKPTEEGNYWHYVEGEVVIWGEDSED